MTLLNGSYSLTNPIEPCDNCELEILGTLTMATAVSSSLAQDAAAGQQTVEVADASAFFVGQWVAVIDTDRMQTYGRYSGDASTILKIVGNTITLGTGLIYSYTVAANATLWSCPSTILIDSKSYVSIHGSGDIDGNQANQGPVFGAYSYAWNGQTVAERGKDGSGISVQDSTHITIKGLYLHDAATNLVFWNSTDVIADTIEAGSSFAKNILVFDVSRVRIVNNYVHDSVNEDGISLYWNVNYAVVQGNLLIDNARYGIKRHSGTYAIMADNIIKDATVGIWLSDSFGNSATEDVVIGNQFENCTHGVRQAGAGGGRLKIISNSFYGGGTAIRFECDQVVVIGNTISNINNIGILAGESGSPRSQCTFVGNIIRYTGSSGAILYVNESVFAANLITHSYYNGVFIEGDNNLIEGNQVLYNDRDSLSGYAGIRIIGDNNRIQNNRSIGAAANYQDYGVWIASGDSNYIRGNALVPNRLGTVKDDGTNTTRDFQVAHVMVTADYAITGDDSIIGVDTTGGAVIVTLPTAETIEGRVYTVKDEGGAANVNAITVATEGAQTIDGAASDAINSAYGSQEYYCDGSNWFKK